MITRVITKTIHSFIYEDLYSLSELVCDIRAQGRNREFISRVFSRHPFLSVSSPSGEKPRPQMHFSVFRERVWWLLMLF